MQIKVRRYRLFSTLVAAFFLAALCTYAIKTFWPSSESEQPSTVKAGVERSPYSPKSHGFKLGAGELFVQPLHASIYPAKVERRWTVSPLDLRKDPLVSLPVKPEPKVARALRIALTFDDGPHPYFTEKLLQTLKAENVPATFFVVGKQVELYPGLVKEIFSQGHEVANHTYSHRDIRRLTTPEIETELDQTDLKVYAITHQRTKYFRPPGGQYDQRSYAAVRDKGYEMVLWTSIPEDHLNPPVRLIYERVLKTARNNGIVLLHSGVRNTLQALPELIVALRKRGFTFVRMSDMNQEDFHKLVRYPRPLDSGPKVSSLSQQ